MSEMTLKIGNPNVKSIRGYYAVAIPELTRKYFKFCKYCGCKGIAEKRKIDVHCKTQHPNHNDGFLLYGGMPEDCIYSNFKEFMEGIDQDLTAKPERV